MYLYYKNDDLETYLLTVMNMVSFRTVNKWSLKFFLLKVAAIYRYASLEAEINILVARLLILENSEVIEK